MLNREAWLQERRTGIGGSDVAAILGLSKWRTALEVYKEKVGELPPGNDTDERKRAGQVLQRPIIDLYCEDHGVELVAYEPEIVRHPDLKFLFASLDAVVRDVHGDEWNLDSKNVHWRVASEWGDEGSDRLPDDAFYQGHHYNFVTGRHRTDFAVLLGGEFPPRTFTVPADNELYELLLEDLALFWDHVKKRVPPAPDFAHKTTAELMKRLYPDVEKDKVITLPAKYLELVERYWLLGQVEKLAKEKRDTLKAEILFAIGDAGVANIDGSPVALKRTPIAGGGVVHYVKEGYVRLDSKFPKNHQHQITVAKAAPLLAEGASE